MEPAYSRPHPNLRLFAMFTVLMLIFVAIGWIIGAVFFDDWIAGSLFFLILAGVLNLVSYLFSDKIVLWSYRAKIVSENEAPRLFKIVRYVAGLNGLPMPKIAIVPSKTPNAFATGRNPERAVVAATEGILELLNDNELSGVIAHEMAHVKDRDILVMSVAATVAGAIAFMARMFVWNMFLGGRGRREGSGDILIVILVAITAPIAAVAVQLAISRSREYKADFVGARTIGKPNYLADALEKLEVANRRRPMRRGNPASSSLFIVNPFNGSFFFTLFSTHPPMEKRVRRLRDMASASIIGSTIEYLWGDDLYTREYVPSGLVIWSDNVSVDSSQIRDAEASAVWISGGSPSISRTWIAHTGGGAVYMDLTNASFIGNTIEFTGESGVSSGGLAAVRGHAKIIGNTIRDTVAVGGSVGLSAPLVLDNTIESAIGVYAFDGDSQIVGNTILSDTIGIVFGDRGDPLIENNTMIWTGTVSNETGSAGISNENSYGALSHGRVIGNTIIGFPTGIWSLGGTETLFLGNTVRGANRSVRCWPESTSSFIGNTFENQYIGFDAGACQAKEIANNTFRNTKAWDFYIVTGGLPWHAVAVNNSFDSDKVLIAEAGSDLTIENYLDARVLDKNLRPLPAATVQVGTIGQSTQLATTDSEGEARWFRVPYVRYDYDDYNRVLHIGNPFKLFWFSSSAAATYPAKDLNNLPDYPSPRSVNMSKSHWEYFIEVGAPDMVELAMESVQATPDPVFLGTPVSITATVRNWGIVNATNVYVEFRNGGLSGTPIGSVLLGGITRLGGSRTVGMSWTPPAAGDYTLCVIADPLNAIPELDENNNGACTNLTVVALPDLAVTPSDVSFLPAPPFANGSTILITAAIWNAGLASSPATFVRFHDGVPPSPAIDGDVPVGPIPVGGSDIAQVQWIASGVGGHEICVVADPGSTVAETDENNNMACVPVQVLSLPDLAPTSIVTVPPSPIPEGTLSKVNVTIVNAGDVSAGGFDLLLFDDSNGNLAPDPGEDVGVHAMTGISGHSQSYEEFSWSAAPAGAHSLCAYADPPPGMVTESNETNNVMCIDILVQPGLILRPDYAPDSPLPIPPIRVGMSSPVSLSIQVLNQGNGTATGDATVAFHEQSSPPFLTFVLSPLAPAAVSSRFTATWTSPAVPGTYLVSVDVDYYDNVTEWDETNNVYTWAIEVVAGPITSLVIGSPNYTTTVTYVKSVTPLDFSVIDQSGLGIRNTTYTIDGGAPVNYTAPGMFFLAGEGEHAVEWRSLDWAGNLEDLNSRVLRVDDIPPATTLSIGDPKYLVGGNFVTSSTPLALLAVDGGVTPVGLDYTEYRVDGGNWKTYSSSFAMAGEGMHVLGYRSRDLLGNSEAIQSIQIVVDNTPPATAISTGEPKYLTGGNFVNSSTPLTLSAADGGVGSNSTFYRLWGGSWSPWRDYSTSFSLAGRDGTWYVEFRSFDYLGNMEAVRNETLILDDTPPVTTISPAAPFTLAAADSGCGVNVTMYRIDGGSWTVYTGGFTLAEGEHTIYYYSIDNLGNVEQERSLVVKPAVEVAVNYKPLIALVFAIILAVIGLLSSKKRPWKSGNDRMAVAKAFAFTSLPFVLAEAGTGMVSLLTGQLSIPPLAGVGTAIDLAILLVGLGAAVMRTKKKEPAKAEQMDVPKGQ